MFFYFSFQNYHSVWHFPQFIAFLANNLKNMVSKHSNIEIEMPPVSVAVEVKNVEFTYKRNYLDVLTNPRKKNKPILKGISLSVPKGKIYALLGASGCGK